MILSYFLWRARRESAHCRNESEDLGGGVIALNATTGTPTTTVTGGANRITNSSAVREFRANGATSGNSGSKDRFYAGFSVPHIINNALNRDYQFLNDSDGARQYRHYFVTAGYVFDLNASLKLKPSFLVKVVEGAPMQMDINANLWFYEKVGVGMSYRSGDSIDALLEFQLSHQFKLGYAYDYTLTELRRYNSGSHEIMLRYQFSANRSKIITPRFF